MSNGYAAFEPTLVGRNEMNRLRRVFDKAVAHSPEHARFSDWLPRLRVLGLTDRSRRARRDATGTAARHVGRDQARQPLDGCSRRDIGIVRHAAKVLDERSADSRVGVEPGRERLRQRTPNHRVGEDLLHTR